MENSIEIVIIFIFVCIAIFCMFDTINTANSKKEIYHSNKFHFHTKFSKLL